MSSSPKIMRAYLDLLNENEQGKEQERQDQLQQAWMDVSTRESKYDKALERSKVARRFDNREDANIQNSYKRMRPKGISPNELDYEKGIELLTKYMNKERAQSIGRPYHGFGYDDDDAVQLLLGKLGSVVYVIDPHTGEKISKGYHQIDKELGQLGSQFYDWRREFLLSSKAPDVGLEPRQADLPFNEFNKSEGLGLLTKNIGPQLAKYVADKFHVFGYDPSVGLLLGKKGAMVRVIDSETGKPLSFSYHRIGPKLAQLGSQFYDWKRAFKLF